MADQSPPFTTLHSTPVDIAEQSEPWCTYRLADGTTMRARLHMVAFRRFDGQWDVQGNPVYSYQTLVEFDQTSPDHMKQNAQPTGKAN